MIESAPPATVCCMGLAPAAECRCEIERLAQPTRDTVIEECIRAIGRSAWKHVGDDAYSQGMDRGAVHQLGESLKAVRALLERRTPMRTITLIETLKALYASEINAGVQSFWDAGFTVYLGDDMNGRKAERTFKVDDLDSAGAYLREAACEHYPESEFAKRAVLESGDEGGKQGETR